MDGARALGRKQVRTPQKLCVHSNDNTQGGEVHTIFETKTLLASTEGPLLGGALTGDDSGGPKVTGDMSPASPMVATCMPMAATSSETGEKVRAFVVHDNCFDQMLKINVPYNKVYQNSENCQNLMRLPTLYKMSH